MTFVDSIPIAKQLAERQLEKGFDVDAFLILASISNMKIDEVPDSNIDEHIHHIADLFVCYYQNQTDDNLQILVDTTSRMLSELYHSIGYENQLTIFKNFIKSLQNIINE